MCKTIAIANQKGGVGKSITTVNLGAGLARKGEKVLIIDLDSQANASHCLGFNRTESNKNQSTVVDGMNWIEEGTEFDVKSLIVHHSEGFDFIPADIRLAGMEQKLFLAYEREHIIDRLIGMLTPLYSYILIDCCPSLGLLPINALTAADSVLVPVKPEDLPVEGLQQLLDSFGMIRRKLNPHLLIEGILYTIVDERTRLAKDVMKLVRDCYGTHVKIFDTVIPQSIKVAESSAYGCSLYKYDPEGKATKAYEALTKEVLA